MFKTLYRCARTAVRHETGPAAQSRLAYLEHLASGGATLNCLRANAGVLYRAAVCMNLDDTSLVERAAVERAATEWAHGKFLNAMASSPEPTEREFRYITCRWLRFARRLQEPARPPTPHQAEARVVFIGQPFQSRSIDERGPLCFWARHHRTASIRRRRT